MCVCAVFLSRSALYQSYQYPSESMAEAEGDLSLAVRIVDKEILRTVDRYYLCGKIDK